MIPGIWAAYQAILALIGIPRWLPVVGLAGLLGMGGAYFYGKHVAAQACHEAALRTKIATLEFGISMQHRADEVEAALNKDLEADRQQLEQKVLDYEAALKKQPASPVCSLSADDVGALDGLHGKRKH